MRFLTLLPVLATFIACAPGAAETPTTATDDLVTSGVCATLDYGPRPPVSELYRFFADDGEVATSVGAMLQLGVFAPYVGAGATVRGVNDDPHVVALVGDVFAGFKRAFPNETAGLDTAPPVVVMQSAQPNAFALGSMFENGAASPKSPWFFVVNTALLERGNTDDELRAVFAHELGHLILQTFKPTVQQRVRHAYTLGGASEDGILGAAQSDDPALAEPIGRLLDGQSRVGGVSQLGMNMVTPGIYFGLLAQMVRAGSPASKPCMAAMRSKLQALAVKQLSFLPGVGEGNLVPKLPNAAENAELETMTNEIIADFDTCAAPGSDVASLGRVAALLQQLPATAADDPADPLHDQVRAGMIAIEREVDASMPEDLLSKRLLAAEASVRADLVSIRASLDLSRVRVYDFEEDADDASVRVLRAIGAKPDAIGDFTLSMLSPASKETCVADVAAGKPIGFGELYDVHPLHCWRYYHAKQINKALAGCDPVRAEKRAPIETHLPLISNDPATVSGIGSR